MLTESWGWTELIQVKNLRREGSTFHSGGSFFDSWVSWRHIEGINLWLFHLEIVTGVSWEAKDTCTTQKVMEAIIVCLSTVMFRTLFLGSCPILLYVPHKLLSGEIGQNGLWCNSHDHHQRAGLPSDAVPHCVWLAYSVATRQNTGIVQTGARRFWVRRFWNIQMETRFIRLVYSREQGPFSFASMHSATHSVLLIILIFSK